MPLCKEDVQTLLLWRRRRWESVGVSIACAPTRPPLLGSYVAQGVFITPWICFVDTPNVHSQLQSAATSGWSLVHTLFQILQTHVTVLECGNGCLQSCYH